MKQLITKKTISKLHTKLRDKSVMRTTAVFKSLAEMRSHSDYADDVNKLVLDLADHLSIRSYTMSKLMLFIGVEKGLYCDPNECLKHAVDDMVNADDVCSKDKVLHAAFHDANSMNNFLLELLYLEANFEMHDADKYLQYDFEDHHPLFGSHKLNAYHHYATDYNLLVDDDPIVGLLCAAYDSHVHDILNTSMQKGLDPNYKLVLEQPACFYHAVEIDRLNLFNLLRHGVDPFDLAEIRYSNLQECVPEANDMIIKLPNFFIMHYPDDDILRNDGWTFPFYGCLSGILLEDFITSDFMRSKSAEILNCIRGKLNDYTTTNTGQLDDIISELKEVVSTYHPNNYSNDLIVILIVIMLHAILTFTDSTSEVKALVKQLLENI